MSDTPTNDLAWPLPITPRNTLGRLGRNKTQVGQVFGRLQVLSECAAKTKAGGTQWECICSCGRRKITSGTNLATGDTKSCGCLRTDTVVARSTKHGYSTSTYKAKIYWVWADMIGRCHNTAHKRYKDYGGRGIFVCDKWRNFKGFIEDMGETPDGLTLDRIDNDKGYSKDNCRWATYAEQNQNRRYNTLNLLLVKEMRNVGHSLTYREIGVMYGVYHGTVGKIMRNEMWSDPDYNYTPRKAERLQP